MGISQSGKIYVIFETDNPKGMARPPEPLGFPTRTVGNIIGFSACSDEAEQPLDVAEHTVKKSIDVLKLQ